MPLCSARVAEWSEGWSMGRPGKSVPAVVVLRQRCTWRVWGLSRKPVWGEQSDQEWKWYSWGEKGAHTMQGTAGHFKDLGFFFRMTVIEWFGTEEWQDLAYVCVCLFVLATPHSLQVQSPDQGLNPALAVEVPSPNRWTAWEFPVLCFFWCFGVGWRVTHTVRNMNISFCRGLPFIATKFTWR